MSAGILKALMQLFAIIARDSGGAEGDHSGRNIVAIFLRQQLNKDLVQRYLDVYDELVAQNQSKKSGGKEGSRKRTSLSSVKVLRICTRINEELAQKEKVFVLVRLLEFISAFPETSEQEWEFVETVADTFNIERETYQHLVELTALGKEEFLKHPEFLFVTGHKAPEDLGQAKYLEKEGLEGKFVFFRLEKENMFLVRYFGNEDLLLNGQSLGTNRAYVFLQGASIRGSKISPIYYSDVIHRFMNEQDRTSIVFRAENVSYYFKRNNKQALHQLNLVEDSGSLIGIMGASGSGKSTLLNVLNGNYIPTFGKVTINGIDIHHEADQIEGVLGYVAQDDLLIEELSVFDNLFYNAKLCFGRKTDEEIAEMVVDTLQQLGLYEARDLKVGSPLEKTISGGQRKRLNIALELIREPAVLFVDEPTSGLSSRDSENIMDLLKELTLKGKLIFVVIHQPSSDIFKMFDKLFILDQGGYPIYYGNPVESILYFKRLVNHVNVSESECPRCGNVNPEQIFNMIESKVVDEYGNLTEHRKISPREWNNFFNVIIGNHIRTKDKKRKTPESSFSIPNRLRQLSVFLTRDILSKVANRQYMIINALEAPLLALVLSFFIKYFKADDGTDAGYIFRESENIPQFLFISVIVALFLGLTVSAEEIIRDQKILKREKFLNLSKGSYLASKIGIMFLISAIQTLMYTIVGNSILEIRGMFLPFWMVLFSTSCFANLLGLNISASFNSAKVIYILIPILIIPQLLFSGVIVKFDKLYPLFSSQSSVPWIGNIMASRWAYEAMAVYQFKNNEHNKIVYEYDQKIEQYRWKKDYWLKELRSKVNESQSLIESGKDDERLAYNLLVIRNEFEKEQKEFANFTLPEWEKLTPEHVTNELLEGVKVSLDRLNDFYKKGYNKQFALKDNAIEALSDTPEKKVAYLQLKDDYTNESLAEFVTNENELEKIVEYNNELVQKSEPVYIIPQHKSFFGAHFYAPTKSFFGRQITTMSANLLVIWTMTMAMVVLLFFDGLKKLLELLTHFGEYLARLLKLRVKFTYSD
ncbi:MAG: ATP-binding cassette domain-containing protein [Flavobacteriales bacterium]|nr:ATP-binding cassette domain-containing protein [Flavobacteriales bacterium]